VTENNTLLVMENRMLNKMFGPRVVEITRVIPRRIVAIISLQIYARRVCIGLS